MSSAISPSAPDEVQPRGGPHTVAATSQVNRPAVGFYMRAFCDADIIPSPQEALDWLASQGLYLWAEEVETSSGRGAALRIDAKSGYEALDEPTKGARAKAAKAHKRKKEIEAAALKADAPPGDAEPDEPTEGPGDDEPKGLCVEILRVDKRKKTLRVAAPPADEVQARETILVNDSTAIILDGRAVALADLMPGMRLIVTPGQGAARRIEALLPRAAEDATPRGVRAKVMKVDFAKKRILLAMATKGQDARAVEIPLPVNDQTHVIIAGKSAQLLDLKHNHEVLVTAVDGAVRTIEVVDPLAFTTSDPVKCLHGTIESVYPVKKSLTLAVLMREVVVETNSKTQVTIDGEPTVAIDLLPGQKAFVIAPTAPFCIPWQSARLKWSQPGSRIVLECNRCDGTANSLVRQEVSWFLERLHAVPTPKRGIAQHLQLFRQDPLGFVRNLGPGWFLKLKGQVAHQMQASKAIIACRIDDANPAAQRARHKLMEFFAGQGKGPGIVQVDGEGFYESGELVIKTAGRRGVAVDARRIVLSEQDEED